MDLQFYEPVAFRTQHKSNRQASNPEQKVDPIIIPDLSDPGYGLTASHCVKKHHELSLRFFNDLIKAGVCREQARGVLPQNLYSQYYGTVNLGNLLKFIELRTHSGAQWEIAEMAKACLMIAEDLWPETIGAYREIRGL